MRALVESIGKGYEGQIGATIAVALDGRQTYTTTIDVPAGVPAPVAPNVDAVYKLIVLLSHSQFGVKSPIAGFGEGLYFEIQQP